jgi:hypothetical protein
MTTETYQGKPCAHGHNGTRYRSNRKCVACSRREVRWIAFGRNGGMTLHHSETDARRHGDELWRATRVK